MVTEWTPTTVFKFLELYKKHRLLWDTKDNTHRQAAARREAWRDISERLGIDIITIRKKYESLMASFRKIKKTVEEQAEPGATYGEVYSAPQTAWYAFDAMRFLLPPHEPNDEFDRSTLATNDTSATQLRPKPPPVMRPRPPIREVMPSSPEQDYEEEYLEYPDDEAPPDDDDAEYIEEEEVSIKLEEPEPQMKRISEKLTPRRDVTNLRPVKQLSSIKKKPLIRPVIRRAEPIRIVPLAKSTIKTDTPSSLPRPKMESLEAKDECDRFAEYVACSLRKHSERTRAMIKQAINNILFEQEMKKYGNSEYTVLYSDDNPLSMDQEQ